MIQVKYQKQNRNKEVPKNMKTNTASITTTEVLASRKASSTA
jgi:hypothetical protein